MRRWMTVLLAGVWLAGCQQLTPPTEPPPADEIVGGDVALTYIEGGWSLGDSLVFFEAHYRDGQLWRIAERIEQGSLGGQRTDYYFRDGQLQRVISEGLELNSEVWHWQRRRFRLRFSGDHFVQGQHFLDGRPQRLSSDFIAWIQEEARQVVEQLQLLQDNGERLWRGYWDGDHFTPCRNADTTDAPSYAILADVGDWDWLSSFTAKLRHQGELRPALIFLGLQQPSDGAIEMTQLMSMQPASDDTCMPLEPLVWDPSPPM
jgi:hypothetical protein